MKNFIIACLFSIFSLACFTACPPQNIQLVTLTINPTSLNYGYQYNNESSWECNVPFSGLPTYGTGPSPVGPGETQAGFTDLYYPGSDPFPCNFNQQMLYRAHIWFPLPELRNIVTATLQWDVDSSVNNTLSTTSEFPAKSYATLLGLSTGPSPDSTGGTYWWNDDQSTEVGIPSCQASIIKPDCQIGVTWEVNQWISGTTFNWGFEIFGPKTGIDNPLPNDNNAQLSVYSSPQLVVVYNPVANPEAPQQSGAYN